MASNIDTTLTATELPLLMTPEESSLDTANEPRLALAREEVTRSLSHRVLRRNERLELHTSHRDFSMPGEPIDLLGSNRDKPMTLPVVLAPVMRPQDEFFVTLQRWEGFVVTIENGRFAAKLVDMTSAGPREDSEFSMQELSEEDLPLLRVGASFYWSIGYRTDARGRRSSVSEIRFRRLPPLTDDELSHARNEAEALVKLGYE